LRESTLSLEHLYAAIDKLTASIAEASARNFARWPESAQRYTYEEEIQRMKDWISQRLEWIDANIDRLAEVDDHADSVPREFVLQQNYPNPFNAGTHIRFGLPLECTLSLDLYNIRGEKAADLFHGVKTAGYHVLAFTGDGLPTGVYLIRLSAGPYTLAVKALIIK